MRPLRSSRQQTSRSPVVAVSSGSCIRQERAEQRESLWTGHLASLRHRGLRLPQHKIPRCRLDPQRTYTRRSRNFRCPSINWRSRAFLHPGCRRWSFRTRCRTDRLSSSVPRDTRSRIRHSCCHLLQLSRNTEHRRRQCTGFVPGCISRGNRHRCKFGRRGRHCHRIRSCCCR